MIKDTEYNLLELPEDLEHCADNIYKYILQFGLENLKYLKSPSNTPDQFLNAFLSLKQLSNKEQGNKLQEFLIASIVMKYSEELNPGVEHFLTYPLSEPTDVNLIVKEGEKFITHHLQIKHIFDYEKLKGRKEPYHSADFETDTLSLSELNDFILPKITEIINSGVYDDTILVLFLRVTGSTVDPIELKKQILEINKGRIKSIFLIMPMAGLKDKTTGEIQKDSRSDILSKFLVMQIGEDLIEKLDEFKIVEFLR